MDRQEAEALQEAHDIAWFLTNGYQDIRRFPDGTWVALFRYLYTWAIISGLNEWGYEDRWCFSSYDKAKAALDAWDGTGEPQGWHRHPKSGRRVDEHGNEYVEF